MNNLDLIVFDVEHGNSIILTLPNQNNDRFMFDAGSRADFSPALHLAKNYGDSIRWLTITHPDTDHITDINYVAKYLKITTLSSHEEITEEFLEEYHEYNIPQTVKDYLNFKRNYYIQAPPMNDASYDWGGVKFAQFKHTTQDFTDINNLSIITFVDYQGWVILLPGDLEKAGWLKHLENDAFRNLLSRTDVLIASHHGRDNGYCEDVFKYCTPHIIIISDKGITDTSCTEKYTAHARGLQVNDIGERKVLTTRNDGAIRLSITDEGKYTLKTFSTTGL